MVDLNTALSRALAGGHSTINREGQLYPPQILLASRTMGSRQAFRKESAAYSASKGKQNAVLLCTSRNDAIK